MVAKKAVPMPFYGEAFYGDEAVHAMSYEQQGIYLSLLWHAWREGSIPDDPSSLAKILRLSMTRFLKAWHWVGKKWSPSGVGRLTNKRQEIERAKRAKTSTRMSTAARSRWMREACRSDA